MIEQVGNSVTFLAQFLDGGALKTGLTVTVNVYRVSDESQLVSGASANEIGASGVYKYTYGPAATEDDYLAVFNTAGVADQVDVPSLWTVGHAGIEFLDASIAARTAGLIQRSEPPAGLIQRSEPPTTAAIWAEGTRTLTSYGTLVADTATAVWASASRTLTSISALAAQIAAAVLNAVASSYNAALSIGAKINTAGSDADPLDNVVPGAYVQGTAGFALGRIGRADIDVTSPVSTSGLLELTRGDDYADADGRALEFLSSSWTNLTDVTEVRLTVRRRPEAFLVGETDEVWFTVTDRAASRTFGAGAQTVAFELTPTETEELEPSLSARERYAGKYDVQATTADGRIITLAVGNVRVVEDQTR